MVRASPTCKPGVGCAAPPCSLECVAHCTCVRARNRRQVGKPRARKLPDSPGNVIWHLPKPAPAQTCTCTRPNLHLHPPKAAPAQSCTCPNLTNRPRKASPSWLAYRTGMSPDDKHKRPSPGATRELGRPCIEAVSRRERAELKHLLCAHVVGPMVVVLGIWGIQGLPGAKWRELQGSCCGGKETDGWMDGGRRPTGRHSRGRHTPASDRDPWASCVAPP